MELTCRIFGQRQMLQSEVIYIEHYGMDLYNMYTPIGTVALKLQTVQRLAFKFIKKTVGFCLPKME